jgi:hypothetical protein
MFTNNANYSHTNKTMSSYCKKNKLLLAQEKHKKKPKALISLNICTKVKK